MTASANPHRDLEDVLNFPHFFLLVHGGFSDRGEVSVFKLCTISTAPNSVVTYAYR
jgi:hypothetical protein